VPAGHHRKTTPRTLLLRRLRTPAGFALALLTAIPVAWTPGTNGAVSAQIVVAPLKKERDFEAWHGKLAGKIVAPGSTDFGSYGAGDGSAAEGA